MRRSITVDRSDVADIDDLRTANREIAKLRRMVDRIRTRQETIDKVRTEVYKAVNKNLTPEAGLQMNSTQIMGILAQVSNANSATQLDVILGTVSEIISKTQLKADMIRMEHYLNKKTQSQTTRGIAKGILVDKDTNEILAEVRGTYKQLQLSFLDDRMKEVRRDIRTLGAEVRELEEAGDMDAAEAKRTKLAEKQAELKDLKNKRNNDLETKAAAEVQTLIDMENQNTERIDDLLAEGKEIPQSLLSFKVSLPLRIKLAQMREDKASLDELQTEYQNALTAARNSSDFMEHERYLNEAARLKNLENTIRKRLIHETREIADMLKDVIDNGAEKRSQQLRDELEHRRMIITMGVEAVDKNVTRNPVRPRTEAEEKKSLRDRFVNEAKAPAQSFNHVLKMIDVNHAEGNSPLYDYLMKGENGAVASNDRYGLAELAARDKKTFESICVVQ